MPKQVKPKQSQIFENGEDLPLFTKSPMRVTEEVFNPKPEPKQLRMFGPPTFEELAEEKAKHGDVIKMPDWLKPENEWIDRGE